MPLFLGADGGQTSSIAVLTDNEGQRLGVGRGGPCNHFDEAGGEQRFRLALDQIVMGAFVQAARPISEGLTAACFGLTGGWERAPAIIHALLPVKRLTVVEDTITSHAGAFAGGPGIVVISGTGSVGYGRDEFGNIARVGGWGYLMGDEGSGYDIGRRALRAAAQAYDGRGPVTMLSDRILAHFGLSHLEDVQEGLYAGQISRMDVASLAQVTAGAAIEQDSVAHAILDAAAAALARMVVAVARRLSWPGPIVSAVGGVFNAGWVIIDPFTHYLLEDLPEATMKQPRYPPVLGALILAFHAEGNSLTGEALQHLDESAAWLGLGK